MTGTDIFEALAAAAGEIFKARQDGARAEATRIRIDARSIALGNLRDEIRSAGCEDGWVAFASSAATYSALDFGDDGRIAEDHGPILAAELVTGEASGLSILHLGGGKARLVAIEEAADGLVAAVRVPRRVLGDGVAWLDYEEYWTVDGEGAARPVAVRLSGVGRNNEGGEN